MYKILDTISMYFFDIYKMIMKKRKCFLLSGRYIDDYTLQQYKQIFDNSFKLSKIDTAGKFVFANKAFLDVYGLNFDELIGKNYKVINHNITSKDDYGTLWHTIKSGKPWYGKISYENKKTKDTGFMYVSIFPIFAKDGNIQEYFSIRHDITDLVNLESQILKAEEQLTVTLASIIESTDTETFFHVTRVAEYAYLMAVLYGLDDEEALLIKRAAPLHDAGKIGLPLDILNKPASLNDDEMDMIKKHSEIGYNFFKGSELPLIEMCGEIAITHHEKWDGTGYPKGLKGEDIPISGRIMAFADVFDALSVKRPYKQPWSIEDIELFLKNEKGKHFEPIIIDLYFEHRELFINILNNTRELNAES